MYERICSNIITTFVASIVLIVSSIGCCGRQHLDCNFPSSSNDCETFKKIEISIKALDRVVQSNHKTIKAIEDFTRELVKNKEEINVFPTSLTLKLLDKGNKEHKGEQGQEVQENQQDNKGYISVNTRSSIEGVVSSNKNIASAKFCNADHKKVCVEGLREGDTVVTIVNKINRDNK